MENTPFSLMKNLPRLTFANGTIPFNLVAAASYSGASLLQCPHLHKYIKKKKPNSQFDPSRLLTMFLKDEPQTIILLLN